jgi:hypothetical protein
MAASPAAGTELQMGVAALGNGVLLDAPGRPPGCARHPGVGLTVHCSFCQIASDPISWSMTFSSASGSFTSAPATNAKRELLTAVQPGWMLENRRQKNQKATSMINMPGIAGSRTTLSWL